MGIEKTNAKYTLIGCDPVNDGIIFDLASLKNANARHLINEKLGVQHNLRSKYLLKIKDYVLLDRDLDRLASFFITQSSLLKDMFFLCSNQDCVDTYFGAPVQVRY